MVRFIYTTISTQGAAKELATKIIEAKLAGCANIINNMTSIYPWDGKLESANECIVIIKTTNDKLDACKAFIKQHHPYEIPCIAQINIEDVNPEYSGWLKDWVSKI